VKQAAISYQLSAKKRDKGRRAVLACAVGSMLFCISCSQNEYKLKGPKPEAPKNARKAQAVQKDAGAGMNALPATPPQSGEPVQK
jgi:hypothetical protein